MNAAPQVPPDPPVGSSAPPGLPGADPQATWTSPASAFGEQSTGSTSIDHGRFVPGTIVAQRFRIVELLGKGGMGEVYRADDLRLGQSVALKFLTEAQAAEVGGLTTLYNEVRTARTVAHPNVCRVYDVGEIDGLAFISMEYVDGENLRSLLQRIGHLPQEKGVELARQLCHGLAAIHAQGLVHRDLKPTNVMVDGRGRARITDFGLAGLAQELAAAGARAGTPAYMPPEQLAGRGVTVRSDLYSLGLVLYEIFTGERAFEGESWTELAHLHEQHVPRPPTQLIDDLDPAIERVVLRCLEKDPQLRPPSALAVAAALPGGDPLAAALAAGETPSPEAVAAAEPSGMLHPWWGVTCVAATVVGLVVLGGLGERTTLLGTVPLERPPAVLQDHARTLIQELGYEEVAADSALGFLANDAALNYLRKQDGVDGRALLRSGEVPGITFWYRQSPDRLRPQNVRGLVSPNDPPPLTPGMIEVRLDARGRLISFHAVTPAVATGASAEPPTEPDWQPLFRQAGLNVWDYEPVAPCWNPPGYSDLRRAWAPKATGGGPAIEGAAYAGRPTWFVVVHPWTTPPRAAPAERDRAELAYAIIISLLLVAILGSGLILAWRNLRLGRGDRRGAFRVAVYLFVIGCASWALSIHAFPGPGEIVDAVIRSLGPTTFYAGSIWLLYLALEPTVRRRWPHRLVSWTRLLAGRVQDPLVGRDVVVGVAAGVALAVVPVLRQLLAEWLGTASLPQGLVGFRAYTARETIGIMLQAQNVAVFNGLIFLFMPLLLFVLVRREWLAGLLSFLLWTALFTFRSESTGAVDLILNAMLCATSAALWTFLALRFGLLATTVQFFVFFLLQWLPLTWDYARWYAGATQVIALLIVLLAAWAYYRSLAGRTLFRAAFLDT